MKDLQTFKHSTFGLLVILMLASCGQNPGRETEANHSGNSESQPLFTLLSPTYTGIQFNNELIESETVNTFIYINAYNGAGVAVGDLNGDHLPDLFFAGNTVSDRLYLNKGHLKFEDVTESAGIETGRGWSTGATIADVNADGWLDIYVCRAFDSDPKYRANRLYINQGDLTFTEEAEKYGLADTGYSTQATFFDYDKDQDLDLFVISHFHDHNLVHEISLERYNNPSHEASDHLYRNNGDGSFTDVTKESGTLTYGSGLGLVAGDINNDGWTDLFIGNDFQEPDVLFINNGDGTFRNGVKEAFRHISFFSMGADLADFNNDRLPDLVALDMLASDHYRQKTQMANMAPDEYDRNVLHGYHHQFMRNVLQLNNGNGTFSDIALLSGVSATDWSWTALLADFDNDQDKDLFVSNGLKRDIQDNDYKSELSKKLKGGFYEGHIDELLEMIPSTPVPNKFFTNNGDLTFSDQTETANLNQPGFSHGAAFGDLDLDGDLDLVINNMDSTASIYRNNSSGASHHYLRIRLQGPNSNRFALGAKVTIEVGDTIQYQELTLTRGYKSSVEPILHFGLGKATHADRVYVEWSNGSQSLLTQVPADQILEINIDTAPSTNTDPWETIVEPLFTEANPSSEIDFRHVENPYNDFIREVLLPHKTSQFGPKISIGDINQDDLDDFFIGGALDQSGALFKQSQTGTFEKVAGPWQQDAGQEDLGSLFFDADSDGDLDLYIVSGGNEFPADSPLLQDRLYINEGNSHFVHSKDSLPTMISSGGCVIAADYDQDGDQDLFVGGRLVPRRYPHPARSYILKNEGGRFTDATKEIAPSLVEPGMVSSALWLDVNKDEILDLVVVGEWMPVSIYQQEDGKFTNQTEAYGLAESTGWWNTIIAEDLDADGHTDLIAGNLGLNYKYHASPEEPFHIYGKDFDLSGTPDIVLGYYQDGICFPVRGMQCSIQQIPGIAEKFATYNDFALASLPQIYGVTKLERAIHYEANEFASCVFYNSDTGKFKKQPLPLEAQIAPLQGLVCRDFNSDGKLDLLLAGNFFVSEAETGRADAGNGLLLNGTNERSFQAMSIEKSGFYAPGDVRDLQIVDRTANKRPIVLVGNNNGPLQIFHLNENPIDSPTTNTQRQ